MCCEQNHFLIRFNPDAIVFDSSKVYGTPSYWMQTFFKESNGAMLLNSTLGAKTSASLAASAILWKSSDDGRQYLRIKVGLLSFISTEHDIKLACNT